MTQWVLKGLGPGPREVLQLLPQRVLQRFIDGIEHGRYSACIKLLESATPGTEAECHVTEVERRHLEASAWIMT